MALKVVKKVDDLQDYWTYLLVKTTGESVVGEWSPKYGQFTVGEYCVGYSFEELLQVWELGNARDESSN